MEIAILIWLASAVIAGAVASGKGRSGLGFAVLGLIIGPIAVLAAACVSRDGKRDVRAGFQSGELRPCPFCAEAIRKAAIKCPHCGSEVPPAPKRNIWGNVKAF